MNITPHITVLNEVKKVLEQINITSYTKPNNVLFGSSIGEHVRHIIEFYLCCLEQKKESVVNYDLRLRNKELEVNLGLCIQTFSEVMGELSAIVSEDDSSLKFTNCMEKSENGIKTSFFRELVYCIDHCIHHQSLIKIALLEQGLIHIIDDEFGVAFSTLEHREQCAS